jgi:hypothetical protein
MNNDEIMTLKEGMGGMTSQTSPSELAAFMATHSVACASTIKAYAPVIVVNGKSVDTDLGDLVTAMETAGNAIANDNNFSGIERMLTAQTLALDAIFNNLAQKAVNAEHLSKMETYLKLALKAQAQARCTAEALSTIKNPQPYISQANISQGHQQVNNTYASASVHTDKQRLADFLFKGCER